MLGLEAAALTAHFERSHVGGVVEEDREAVEGFAAVGEALVGGVRDVAALEDAVRRLADRADHTPHELDRAHFE